MHNIYLLDSRFESKIGVLTWKLATPKYHQCDYEFLLAKIPCEANIMLYDLSSFQIQCQLLVYLL